MPLRPATYRDLSTITDIFAEAFLEDAFQAWMMPHRYELPEHYQRAWRHKVHEHWWDYQKTFIVTYEIENGKEVITAAAEWARQGHGWEDLWGIKGRWDPRLLIKPILTWYHNLHRRIFPNRCSRRPTAEDPNPLTYWTWLPAVIPFSAKFWIPPNSTPSPAPPDDNNADDTTPLLVTDTVTPKPSTTPSPSATRPPFWELAMLSTHPARQGQGYGRTLCKWGLDIARQQDLPCVLVAAENRERFYRRCGWTNLVGYATQGEGNPLAHLGGGAIMWTQWPWIRVEEGEMDKEKEDKGKAIVALST